MKPYENKDEMTKGYENLFPKNKDKLKIIVAEH